jgi:hypothetical protein
MISLVLGHIALLLFFLPVLGIPVSGIGLISSVVGIALAPLSGLAGTRWCLAGGATCVLALFANLAISHAS